MTGLIVSDIDGTLTDGKRRIITEAITVMREAEKAGFNISLSTGNTLGYALGASRLIGTSGGVIAEDGGIISYKSKIEMLGTLDEPMKCYELIKEKAALLPTFLRKTEVVVDNITVDEILEVVMNHNLAIEVCDSTYGIHIKNRGVNKGTAMKKLAEMMQIPLADTVFIGDSYNDLPAFEVTGYSIAVKNAVPELKEIADYITEGSFGEGGAEAVRKIMGEAV
ncbi:MAG: phosphoglycolate phosphatase [Euryarchaeota archaeon]|nr:phosphoglycolate phosphatase [Euryarchaeota archaeon]